MCSIGIWVRFLQLLVFLLLAHVVLYLLFMFTTVECDEMLLFHCVKNGQSMRFTSPNDVLTGEISGRDTFTIAFIRILSNSSLAVMMFLLSIDATIVLNTFNSQGNGHRKDM